MTKNELVIATAEFINEKVRENLAHTYVEPMFVVDVNKFLEDLIDASCRLNEEGREKMFISVMEEIEIGNAPIDDCDDYKITDISVYDGEITFTKEDDEMED